MSGIIYLIQPEELVGTKRYKIGCSGNTSLSRIKSYKKDSRYIIIMECEKPFEVEKKIIKKFNEKFKLIAGKEYFEGNENKMKIEFLKIVENKKKVIKKKFKKENKKEEQNETDKIIKKYEDKTGLVKSFINLNEKEIREEIFKLAKYDEFTNKLEVLKTGGLYFRGGKITIDSMSFLNELYSEIEKEK